MPDKTQLSEHDLTILRRLAERQAELAAHPVNRERREAWYKLDSGAPDRRPMILAEHGGVRDARRAGPDQPLACHDDFARSLEYGFHTRFYLFETLQDDHVVEPYIDTPWHVKATGYGVEPVVHKPDESERMGSRKWDPPLTNLDSDLGKLRQREFSVDRAASEAARERLEAIFADLLTVRIRGSYWWTLGMTIRVIDLIGLDNLMLYMFDNPEGLHRLMSFLCEDHLTYAEWLEGEGLLCLNNENDYIGSGSMGYSRELGSDAAGGVRTRDQWALLESQETVGVGPKQFAEFIYPYQARLAERFGKIYYGCCEPVHNRWHVLKELPNLARISVSPWANQHQMAEACGDRIVFSRKPNPTLISTERFDEAAILADLRETVAIAGSGRLEIIMKDVHTLNNAPERLPRWVALARQAVAETTTAIA